MRYIQIDKLKEGMRVAKNVYSKDGEIIVYANRTVDKKDIENLQKKYYKGIYIFDNYLTERLREEVIPIQLREESISSLKAFALDDVIYCSNSIVERLMEKKSILLDLNEIRKFHMNTFDHCVNVALLAVSCGIGMGLSYTQLCDLAMAAMLHDIGKITISRSILDKPGRLTDEERNIIMQHPLAGYKLLCDKQTLNRDVLDGIMYHHENQDGSGYPSGLRGDNIPIIARIIHVADVYDAMSQARAYKKDFVPAECFAWIYDNCDKMFDRRVVEVFAKYIVLYPEGTLVKLSNGLHGRVLYNNPENNLAPYLKIVETNEYLDLRAHDELEILEYEHFYKEETKDWVRTKKVI